MNHNKGFCQHSVDMLVSRPDEKPKNYVSNHTKKNRDAPAKLSKTTQTKATQVFLAEAENISFLKLATVKYVCQYGNSCMVPL